MDNWIEFKRLDWWLCGWIININDSNQSIDKSISNKLIELSRWIITIQNISLKFSHHLSKSSILLFYNLLYIQI